MTPSKSHQFQAAFNCIDIMNAQLLRIDEDETVGSIRDLILSLRNPQKITNTNILMQSLAGADGPATTHFYQSDLSSFYAGNNSDDNANIGDYNENNCNSNSNNDNDEPKPSTSGNYYNGCAIEYKPSTSVFATLLSGNLLSRNEVVQIFSRFGKVKEVEWAHLNGSDGYIIEFSNENEKDNIIKIWGSKLTMEGRILKLWCPKQPYLLFKSKLDDFNDEGCNFCPSKEDDKRLCGSGNILQSKVNKSTSNYQQSCNDNKSSTNITNLNEYMPSPERPRNRPTPATALLLKQISQINNKSEINHFCDRISWNNGKEKNQFLNLPAPYHLLPDTPYFRRAPIVPPPTRNLSTTEQISVQQRIINRYLASMKIDDENGFDAIAKYEQQCYQQLSTTTYYPSTLLMQKQQILQNYGDGFRDSGLITANTAKKLVREIKSDLLTPNDLFAPPKTDDRTRICTYYQNNFDNNYITLPAT
ncbi:unnamed protein product [Thelazia callipaeda]|uniref:RRM domain-containing protein n=1 Tax=Thelazia callipaeda TaxID=103827 RepID=A0A158RCS7_THECL|nr:unnamed protein product [Thelazia callipaeda]